MGTNPRKEDSLYLEWEPITGGKNVYTWSGKRSHEGRKCIHGVRTNHRREESLYLEWEPITRGRAFIPGVRTDHRREVGRITLFLRDLPVPLMARANAPPQGPTMREVSI